MLAASFLVCCGQTPAAKPAVKSQDSTLLAMENTRPKPLHPEEFRVYSTASRRFFDSLFSHGFNGGLVVAHNGVVVYERYSGFTDPKKHKDTVNAHTAFHLASVSKTFTAMAVLKLWEAGKLDIHDDISKYLAGFPPGISIKNLLSQRSGLRNYVHFMDQSGWDKRKYLTNTDLLQYIIQHHDQVIYTTAGRHFEYSNTNYAFLALIIEKVSGQSYNEYLTKTFFQPLHMQDTYVYSIQDTEKAIRSYKLNGRLYPMEYLDMVYGDKNIYSTPEDMLKWDDALRGSVLFKQSTLDSAYAPYSLEKPGKRNYGLGWRMIVFPEGKKLIYHNGWWHGNRTVFIRMMEENATIIALCNNDNKKIYFAKKLCDVFGNYQQSHENFDEPDNDPEGRGGEKR
jgi:CubicO group peptidase (beta-lactamase class C family)